MLNSKFLATATFFVIAVLSSSPAWAGSAVVLPGPGIVGLIAAAVVGAIAVSRARK